MPYKIFIFSKVFMEHSLQILPNHPNTYTVFQPNVLIGANIDLNLAEARLYSEVLNINHREEPKRLNYSIPYTSITDSSELVASKKTAQEVLRIIQSFQKRTFFLNKEFMHKHFGEKHPVSINPFPTIRYESGSFDITLNSYFKEILLRLDLGFTKGDIELIRGFKHEASHRLYWLIRSVQWKVKGTSLSFEIEEFKAALGCTGLYENRFDNFKKVIINPIQEEFRKKWVEFEYTLDKGGKGGKVKGITLEFKSDFELEKLLKLGYRYKWEETLTNYGLHERDIIHFRHSVTYKAEIKPGHIWDTFYIESCIQIALKLLKVSENSKGKNKIKSFNNYLYTGISEGWWLDEIAARRPRETTPVNQISIFEQSSEVRPLKRVSFPLHHLEETYNAWKINMKVNTSIESFAREHGYKIIGDIVEKID